MMPSDKSGHRHAYKKSIDNLRSAQSRPSSSGSQTPTQAPRRRPSTLLRNTSASNTDSSSKRNAQTKTAGAGSSSITALRPSPPSTARDPDRDSFCSITEDPFFQGYDPSSVDNLPAEAPRNQQPAAASAQGNEWEAEQRSTRPRRESLTIGSSQASQLRVCPHKTTVKTHSLATLNVDPDLGSRLAAQGSGRQLLLTVNSIHFDP